MFNGFNLIQVLFLERYGIWKIWKHLREIDELILQDNDIILSWNKILLFIREKQKTNRYTEKEIESIFLFWKLLLNSCIHNPS